MAGAPRRRDRCTSTPFPFPQIGGSAGTGTGTAGSALAQAYAAAHTCIRIWAGFVPNNRGLLLCYNLTSAVTATDPTLSLVDRV